MKRTPFLKTFSQLIFGIFLCISSGVQGSRELPTPNELGEIMVLMYHDIGPGEGTWRRTPENLKKDLNALYQRNYYPIRLVDFVNGTVDAPKGKSPVVITFDDGHKGQFQLIKSQKNPTPTSNSAVGILKQFESEHADFPARATFFLHGKRPFGQKHLVEKKLNYLIENGMDVGNHTSHHQNLGQKKMQTPLLIQRAIGNQAKFITQILNKKYPSYVVETYALCYGRRPNRRFGPLLKKGTVGNFKYRNIAILNVGAGPSLSPYDNRFKPFAIPRIRASEKETFGTGIYDWLKHFDENPSKRFVSDGVAKRITVSKDQLRFINDAFLKNANFAIHQL